MNIFSKSRLKIYDRTEDINLHIILRKKPYQHVNVEGHGCKLCIFVFYLATLPLMASVNEV